MITRLTMPPSHHTACVVSSTAMLFELLSTSIKRHINESRSAETHLTTNRMNPPPLNDSVNVMCLEILIRVRYMWHIFIKAQHLVATFTNTPQACGWNVPLFAIERPCAVCVSWVGLIAITSIVPVPRQRNRRLAMLWRRLIAAMAFCVVCLRGGMQFICSRNPLFLPLQ